MYASIILDTYISKTLDYSVPSHLQNHLHPGTRVEVPLRKKVERGYVYSLKKEPEVQNVKAILGLLPKNTWIQPEIFQLGLWMAKYYMASLDQVFRCMVPPSIRKEVKPLTKIYLRLLKTKKKTLEEIQALRTSFPAQAEVLSYLLQKNGAFQHQMLAELRISKSPVDTLVTKKLISLEKIEASESLFLEEDYFRTPEKILNNEQERAFLTIQKTMDSNTFNVHLIHGITGSGKTEIYMQLIQHALDKKKSALVLVPEVALTSQLIESFRARFTEPVAILHHKRSLGERSSDWDQIIQQKKRIILGARSAIFSPAKELGLIIVDEEHDPSYKQTDEAPTYHARDVAIMRGKMQNTCVVLGSATPSIESYYKALSKKYTLSTLNQRATKATLPSVNIINMVREYEISGGYTHFSSLLLEQIKARYERGEQTILFLNRRGFRASQLCSFCSYVFSCPHCDLALTFHKKEMCLRCHLCDYTLKQFRKCPSCGSLDTFQYKGFGTEHIEQSLHAIFPEIRTLRIDRDTTRNKTSHEDLIYSFRSGKASVLIGTQMIAKGLHFPSVTLVGILNTDGALSIPDFRSSEYVFQLITQVAGRAGRAEMKGEVIIQTHMPDHPTILLAKEQNYPKFYEREINHRKDFLFPPFGRLIKLTFSSEKEEAAKMAAEQYRSSIKPTVEDYLFDVIPSGYAKVKDLFRYQFLIRTRSTYKILAQIEKIKAEYPLTKSIRLIVDVDPIHVL